MSTLMVIPWLHLTQEEKLSLTILTLNNTLCTGKIVSKIIVEKIACLHFLKTCASRNIKDPYSREMMQPTETVSQYLIISGLAQ